MRFISDFVSVVLNKRIKENKDMKRMSFAERIKIRQQEAVKRQATAVMRTPHEQIALISTRPGNSSKELTKLQKQMAIAVKTTPAPKKTRKPAVKRATPKKTVKRAKKSELMAESLQNGV